jgi:hypothetical protein
MIFGNCGKLCFESLIDDFVINLECYVYNVMQFLLRFEFEFLISVASGGRDCSYSSSHTN